MLKRISVAMLIWSVVSVGVWWAVNHLLPHHSVRDERVDNSNEPPSSKHAPDFVQQPQHAADDHDRQDPEMYLRKVQCAELGRQFAKEWSELYQTNVILLSGKSLVTYAPYETRFNAARQGCYVEVQSAKGPRLYDVTAGPGSIPIASFDLGKDGDLLDEVAFMDGAWKGVMK